MRTRSSRAQLELFEASVEEGRFPVAGYCADRRYAPTLSLRENSAANFAEAPQVLDGIDPPRVAIACFICAKVAMKFQRTTFGEASASPSAAT